MAYSSLNSFIKQLEKAGELIRIKEFVDPVLEIAEITDRFSKQDSGGKALLFENTGTGFPVLMNMMGSEKRMAMAFGVSHFDEVTRKLEGLMNSFASSGKTFFDKLSLIPELSRLSASFPGVIRSGAPSQEVRIPEPDLGILPILKTWPFDGGRFITFPMVITRDPFTNIRNVGMYRMQVFNRNTTGMHWHRHKTGANHFMKYKEAGKIMPVAVALGGDPLLTWAATAPLPENIDEYLFAGFLRQKKVRMVKALTQDILVPADADIILEGYVDPAEENVLEGPFGDHTGFYSLEDYYPQFHLTAITHRKNAVYPATLVGIPPQEDARIAGATEKIFFFPLRYAIVPELKEMTLPEFGVAHNLTVVKIKKNYPGQARKVMNALWGAGQMMFNKVLIVLDEDAVLENEKDFIDKMESFIPERDLIFSDGPLDVLDHASEFAGFGGKLGIDLTRKFPEEKTEPSYDNPIIQENPSLPKGAEILTKKFIKDSEGRNIVVFLGVEKKENYNRESFINDLLKDKEWRTLSAILFTDHFIDTDNLYDFMWYLLNNIEVRRDILLRNNSQNGLTIVDGTAKINPSELTQRAWPNPVTMSKSVIRAVDEKWERLNLGKFISSPSLHYRQIKVTSGARIRTKDND